MEFLSVFDMLKIGVGPSSSHTLGPWRAAQRFLKELHQKNIFEKILTVYIELYGSLSLTGIGHATDIAVVLGLSGTDPEYIPIEDIQRTIKKVKSEKTLNIDKKKTIPFIFEQQVVFRKTFLPFHANGLTFRAVLNDNSQYNSTFYSIGGGFVIKEEEKNTEIKTQQTKIPFPIENASDLLRHTTSERKKISEIVTENEKILRSQAEISKELLRIWNTMLECMYIGCHTEGTLPGGLNVRRRAFDIHRRLMKNNSQGYTNIFEWLEAIRGTKVEFRQILKWVSCFALAVNEVNASLGRVVTAPTNGSAGVIPSVLMYYMVIENHKATNKEVENFLKTAGVIGGIFKKGATISAAMGGCQAEIGVSSAMAAGALCELLGGTAEQVLIACEIAMEHHLGLTCDPIGGLVQIPCIERNTMGAIKAINAAELALETDAKNVKVPLDKVIKTMWNTAQDMNHKYKETSEGGLAIAVNMADC